MSRTTFRGHRSRRSRSRSGPESRANGATPLAIAAKAKSSGIIALIRCAQDRGFAGPDRPVAQDGDSHGHGDRRQSGDRRAVAAQAGVDEVVAESNPEEKLQLIRREQAQGRLVAMTGDGTNDAPALAQADVGVAMHSGTIAAKEAANLVDLDSDPTKLLDLVGIGKQMLITRGALTTFSIANDVAKYFAILPGLFTVASPASPLST